MAPKRVYARSNNSRSYKRRKMGYKRRLTTYQAPTISSAFTVPSLQTVGGSRLKTCMLYTEAFSLNPGAGGIASVYVFNLNSLFDPNVTGVGHQPTGFDQLMAIYEQYTVYGVKYKVSINNVDATQAVIAGVTTNDSSTTQTDPRVYMENGQTEWKGVSNRNGAGEDIVYFSNYVDLAKVHGLPMNQYLNEDVYAGTQTTNPTENSFLHVWAAAYDNLSDPGTQFLWIELEMFCVLKGGKLNQLS